jgi:hypothetical protein
MYWFGVCIKQQQQQRRNGGGGGGGGGGGWWLVPTHYVPSWQVAFHTSLVRDVSVDGTCLFQWLPCQASKFTCIKTPNVTRGGKEGKGTPMASRPASHDAAR